MSKSVYFKVHGEWLTDFIRDLYYSGNESYETCKEKLIGVLNTGSYKMTEDEKEELASSIIFGEKKLTGINEMSLVDDKDFDVYNYATRFKRPEFKGIKKGIRGILTKSGLFVPCEFMGHASTIEYIGEEKCIGAVQFWMSLSGCGISKDKFDDKFTKQQINFFYSNIEYMHPEQVKDWARAVKLERFYEKYNKEKIKATGGN